MCECVSVSVIEMLENIFENLRYSSSLIVLQQGNDNSPLYSSPYAASHTALTASDTSEC